MAQKIYKSPKAMGTPINRDDYIGRILKEKADYNQEGLYNDDEIKEMAGYVFDDYGFDKAVEETWDEDYPAFSEYRDHFLDNFGGLHYDRGIRGVPWSYPSGWDRMDVESKNNAIDYYLDGYYNQKSPDHKYAKQIRNDVYKNIDDYYKARHNRDYKGSKLDHLLERASYLPEKYKGLIDVLKSYSDEDINEIIETFGFNNSKERDY